MMTNRENIEGLVLLDSTGTLDRMSLEEIKSILGFAAAAKCGVIIATGDRSSESTKKHLGSVGLPIESWPPIHTHAAKDVAYFYENMARNHELPLDRIVLLDDMPGNIACAHTAGIHALNVDAWRKPSMCSRYLNGDPWKRESFGEELPLLETLQDITSAWITSSSTPDASSKLLSEPTRSTKSTVISGVSVLGNGE